MDKALSGADIMNATNGALKIMTYPQLTKYNYIKQAFGNNDGIALLYPFRGSGRNGDGYYGHWTLLMRNNRKDGPEVEFFDSYSNKPDDQLKFAKGGYREEHNMKLPHLTKLLYDATKRGYNVEYNNHKLQGKGGNIETCGRHVITRYLMRNLDVDQYNDLMNKLQKETGLNKDQLVTEMTREI